MYEVQRTEYGVRFFLQGFIREEEAAAWYEEMISSLKNINKGFKVFVDMRGFRPASEDVQAKFVDIQRIFKDHGMNRSVVILDNTVAVMQLIRTAKESGIYDQERYLTPENNPDWEQQAMDWILKGRDPDR